MSNRQKDFISELKTQGLARTSRFSVDLSPPNADPASVRRTLLFCEQAALPGLNYATTQNRVFGELREIPYEKLYDTINLRFHVDRHMHVKKIFDDWMHMIQNPVTRNFSYYRDYISDMKIYVQDLEDRNKYVVQLYECYPKTMSAIALDAEGKDTMRLDVTIQYKYWSSNQVEEAPSGELITSDNSLSKYFSDFTGFQERFRKGLGEAGNFVTGAVGQYAMRSFSQVTSRIPSIKF